VQHNILSALAIILFGQWFSYTIMVTMNCKYNTWYYMLLKCL